jgi:hypothetical protein
MFRPIEELVKEHEENMKAADEAIALLKEALKRGEEDELS